VKWTSERRALRSETRQLLAALGRDADQVASALGAGGVRGKRTSTRECAIAVYVSAIVGADERVSAIAVAGTRMRITLQSHWTPPVVVWLPPAVRQFVSAFDAGRFPSLVRGSVSQQQATGRPGEAPADGERTGTVASSHRRGNPAVKPSFR
jgi:hypothetical protein